MRFRLKDRELQKKLDEISNGGGVIPDVGKTSVLHNTILRT